jgi:hypothetical protein
MVATETAASGCGAFCVLLYPGGGRQRFGATATPAAAAASPRIPQRVRRRPAAVPLYERASLCLAAPRIIPRAAAYSLTRSREAATQPWTRPTPATRQQGRIPLQDLVRFKERQWFVEELEVGRSEGAAWRVRTCHVLGKSNGRAKRTRKHTQKGIHDNHRQMHAHLTTHSRTLARTHTHTHTRTHPLSLSPTLPPHPPQTHTHTHTLHC